MAHPLNKNQDVGELEPLLGSGPRLLSQQSTAPECSQTPLPKLQLGVLCFLRMLDPMSFTQIFPYVNQFMSDLRVTDDPSRIGFYSGLVESAFAIFQLLSIYPWGFLSDIVGRRPIVLLGVAGLSLTTILFGLSRNFTEALVARALAGLFSGNVAVIPSMLYEITDSSNQALAFPFFGIWWSVGAVIGPLIGGTLSNVSSKYPFLDYDFLETHPYFFPCFVVSSFCFAGLFLAILYLQESGPVTHIDATYQLHGVLPSREHHDVKRLISIPIIRALCASGCVLSFISTAFDVVFVLFCYSPVATGGLGFDVSQIGFALAASGMIAALLQMAFMPIALRRINHAKMYHFCMKLWPYTFFCLPFLNLLARHNIGTAKDLDPWTTWLLWMGIAMILVMARIAFLAYSVNMLLVKKYSPHPSAFGSVTGLVQFSICFSRAFSPVIASWMFALSVDSGIIGGHSWMLVMVATSVVGHIFSKKVVLEAGVCDSTKQ